MDAARPARAAGGQHALQPAPQGRAPDVAGAAVEAAQGARGSGPDPPVAGGPEDPGIPADGGGRGARAADPRVGFLGPALGGIAGFPEESRSLAADVGHAAPRSEEHTSELQSLMRISYAVFCLKK